MDINSEFDVIIVGGGMVGAAQAVAFTRQNKRVLLIENHLPQLEWLDNPPLRVSAVNLFSEKYLTELGIWPHISEQSSCVFNHLATWEKQNSEKVVFSAEDISQPQLGYLTRNEALQLAAYDVFKELENPPCIISDVELCNICQSDNDVIVTLKSSENNHVSEIPENNINSEIKEVKAKLLIGADGANSAVRRLANIGTSGWDYQQHCLSITIKTEFQQQDITWQEFQPSGPKAFLPLNNGYASLIWYDAVETIKSLKQLDNAQLKTEVLNIFPQLAGDFEVVQCASFPLTRRQANQYCSGRIVLIGDAAHTINPLAGQGVNLGYKDVSELSSLLDDVSFDNNTDISKALRKYQHKRKAESLVMSAAMDSFYSLFSNDKTPLKLMRKTLLSVANKLPWAKKQVLKKAVGY